MAEVDAPRRRWWQVLLSIVLIVLVSVPVAIALVHRGYAGTAIDAGDRDVWVTNATDRLAGRLNGQIQELDAATSATTRDFEVFQDAAGVFVHDDALGTVSRLDPGTGLAVETASVPLGSRVEVRGGLLAVLERATGTLWVADVRSGLRFDHRTTEPVLRLGPSAQIAVTERGHVLAAAVGDESLYRVPGVRAHPQRTPLGLELRDFELTAVGDRGVVLDIDDATLVFDDGRRVALATNGIRLQEVSAADDFVAVAAASELVLVPLRDGAKVESVNASSGSETSSDPRGIARPVVHDGCHFGAWGATAVVAWRCPGQQDVTATIPVPLHGGELRFRSGGGELALNNLLTGDAFLPLQNMRQVHNWQEVLPDDRRDPASLAQPEQVVPLAQTLAARTASNRAPRPEDDLAGVRDGATVVVPVLANDRDPDGDVLTIADVQPLGAAAGTAAGRIDVVDDGRALRFTPDPGVTGSIAYTYRVSDGRSGGTAEAIVRIRIVPEGEHSPPQQLAAPVLRLEQGRTGSIDALDGWIDAEGDLVHLVAASADEALDVRFTPDGTVTATAAGEPGRHEITLVVSDGAEQRAGTLALEIAAPGTLAPDTTADYAIGTTEAPLTIDVLANDLGVGDERPALLDAVEIEGRPGVHVDAAAGTVTLDTRRAGTYAVLYTVQAGPHTSLGLARFDVRDPAQTGEVRPVAVPDAVHLQGLQPASVDLLANDVGDRARVLVVAELSDTRAAEEAGLRVELVDHATLRVTPTRPFGAPVALAYTVSDGESSDRGTVVVTPGTAIEHPRPPLPVADTLTVRAGDIAVLAPLDNDTHPDRLDLRLDPRLLDVQLGDGIADIAGDLVRLQAPTTPGTYSFACRVRDALAGNAVGRVTVTVTAPDPAGNRPPRSGALDVRATSGVPTRITLPLGGTDPDGDFVTIQEAGATDLGQLVEVGAAHVTFEAHPGATGTATVPVTVRDTLGATATVTLRIGIVPPPLVPATPVAGDDAVEAPPGLPISVRVLDNDSDPAGLALRLAEAQPAGDSAAAVTVDGDALVITPPPGLADFTVPYAIENAAGERSTAFVTVSVRDGVVAPRPSVANHVVSPAELAGTSVVDVNVLEGAHHPTGTVGELLVEVLAPDARVTVDGGVLRVQAGTERLVIPYRVTSPVTGATATAFVVVPPRPRV